jgi:DNA-binding NarL/FixJ family response regulator
MIVDEQPAVRLGVRQLVDASGRFKTVAEAAEGYAALAMALQHRPHIVILDLLIPGLNGIDLARQVRQHLPKTTLVIYTMYHRDELFADALSAGCRSIILKSDDPNELMAGLTAVSLGRPYLSASLSGSIFAAVTGSRGRQTRSVLTPREREITQQIAEGRLNREIAERLAISIKTVETHRASVMSKLALRTTADLVRYAIRNNLAQA